MDLSDLEKQIKVEFNDKKLLKQALTHRSYINENPDIDLENNERLEFLGDAVLEIAVTEYLYHNYENPEGELTNWRAALVNARMLAEIAGRIELDNYLLLSKGEAKDKGRARRFILADALEALIGAIYLDRGYDEVRGFIKREVLSELPRVIEEKLYQDPKSRFQEEAQDKVGITPNYKVVNESGPDHNKKFVVGVYLEKELVAKGEGSSKQEAETAAAEAALEEKEWN